MQHEAENSILARQSQLQLPTLCLSLQSWGPKDGLPIIALHGWLDNSASFEPLAQALLKRCPNIHLIAVDLPGHGHSEHSTREFGHFFVNYITIIFQLIDALKLKQCTLLGHSMGAGAATLAAGTLPEKISQLVLIEGLGPFSDKEDQAPLTYRSFLEKSQKQSAKVDAKKIYTDANLKTLIYRKSITNSISQEAAHMILKRNMTKTNQGGQEGYIWNSDPRLNIPSPLFLTERQICAFIKNIQADSLLLLAKQKLFPQYFKKMKPRIKCLSKVKVHKNLAGGHHLHIEEAQIVSELIASWLRGLGLED